MDVSARPSPADLVCPRCHFKGLTPLYEFVNGKCTEVLHCGDCYHAYYYNEAGELVHFGRIMG